MGWLPNPSNPRLIRVTCIFRPDTGKRWQVFSTTFTAIQRLNGLAIRQLSKCGTVVIFIDEAHLLSTDTFENLRLLTNLESDDNKLIQIVLAGPETGGAGMAQSPLIRIIHEYLWCFKILTLRASRRLPLPGSIYRFYQA